MSLSASILPGLLGDGALLMPSVTVAHMARPMRRSNEGVSVEEGTGRVGEGGVGEGDGEGRSGEKGRGRRKKEETNTGKVRLVAQLIKRVHYDASKYFIDDPDMIEGVVEEGKGEGGRGGGGSVT